MKAMAKLKEKIVRYLDPTSFSLVMGDAFTHRELARCMSAEGFDYPGVRIQSVSREQLAHDLAMEALEHDAILARLIPRLDCAYHREIALIQKMDIKEFNRQTKTFDEVMLLGRAGGIIWACIVDARKQVNTRAGFLAQKALTWAGGEMDRASSGGGFSRGRPTISAKTQKEIVRRFEEQYVSKERERADLSRAAERLEKENASLKQQLREYKTSAERLAAEKGHLNKEHRRLEDRVRSLSEQLASLKSSIPASPKFRLRSQIRALEKENQRLHHELERVNNYASQEALAEKEKRAQLDIRLKEANDKILSLEGDLERYSAEIKRLSETLKSQERQLLKRTSDDIPLAAGKRVGIFVDGQNVFFLARDCYGKRLDYKKLLTLLVRDRHLVKAVCYVVEDIETDQERFLKMLHLSGYVVRKRTLIRRADGSVKANWDVGIATDVITLVDKNKLDIVVLVTCDGDFIDLIELLKHKGVRAEVAGFPFRIAMSLQKAADDIYIIGEDLMFREQQPHTSR